MFCFRRTVIYLAALLGILGATSLAANDVVKGYLVDVACSGRRARKSEPPTRHSRMCMQLPDCSNNGFGILTGENRFILFNEEGNQKARDFLAQTTRESDFKITVTGSMDGDRLKVSRIELQ